MPKKGNTNNPGPWIRGVVTRRSVQRFVIFVLPFVIWLFVFRRFYPGELVLGGDGPEYFGRIKHYVDNILRGVYPMWDPFWKWGSPDDFYPRVIGEFNPFLSLLALLTLLGVPFSMGYFLYAVGYFFLGVAGFYLLVRRLFRDDALAYLAMILLLFSSLGATFFNGPMVILLLVPMIWFFYFLVAFTQDPGPGSLLGMTLAAMVLAITYLPFYFLTIFLAVMILPALLFGADFVEAGKKGLEFCRRNKPLTAFCLLSVGLSLVPGLLWFRAAGAGEMVFSWRHAGAPLQNVAGLSLETASLGSILTLFMSQGLFANLRDLQMGLFYVPVFAFLLILMGAVTRMTRRMILFLTVGVLLLLVSMTSLTPVHRFLYAHVFYFRYVRNLHYFLWFALPFFILFLVELLRQVMDYQPRTPAGKRIALFFILAVHAGFAAFLARQENVVGSSYIVVFLSLIFFGLLAAGRLRPKSAAFRLSLLLLVVIQPLEVLGALGWNSRELMITYERERFQPAFSFVRPLKEKENFEQTLKERRIIRNARDTSGFVGEVRGQRKYRGLRSAYRLHEGMDYDILQAYVRSKFVVYDRIEPVDDQEDYLPRMAQAFAEGRNVAFVAGAAGDIVNKFPGAGHPQPRVIRTNSETFRVLQFDLNRITLWTDFPVAAFLVYNDGFHSGWRATVNGEKADVFRANLAFKGIVLPPGENLVALTFGSPWRYGFNIFMIFYFLGFLFLVVYVSLRGRKAGRVA